MTNTNLIERLREDDEMLRDGPQDNLTVAWHTVAMKHAAADCSEAAALIEQQEAVIAGLVEALAPFARSATWPLGGFEDERPVSCRVYKAYAESIDENWVTGFGYSVGEFRRAEAALLAAKTHLDRATP